MSKEIEKNERSALAQNVVNQPDGPGKRIGKRGEIIAFGKVVPGSVPLFRERLPQFQAEAAYWEGRIGTVHDFRITLIDNDTRILFAITYDGDFQPYVHDIIAKGHEWFDKLMPGVWEGFTHSQDPVVQKLLLEGTVTSDFFYVAHPDVTVHDIHKMKRLSNAVGEMLDAAA
ncbi:hypothetical protein [Roseateles sp.]|uniref:hypothetical protein n=1 Tax=Roseateles sp. TaxID=1971397 RepID=UPI0039E808BF